MAMEKVSIPIQYFKAKSRVFRMIDMVASKYLIEVLYSFDIYLFRINFHSFS